MAGNSDVGLRARRAPGELTGSVLEEIFDHKRREVAERKRLFSMESVRSATEKGSARMDFVAAVRSARAASTFPALIAVVKRASPSRGLLVADFDPVGLARLYRQNGAAAISVLTDEGNFKGHLDFLSQIRSDMDSHPPRLPLLRKDFICDPYQVYESRAARADALLLIVAGLSPGLLRDLHQLALALGMTPLVEVHSPGEVQIALGCNPRLIGINNRDLRDFSVRLQTTLQLRELIPAQVCLVSESGIHTPRDVERLAEAGIDATLVGEALVTAHDVAGQVRLLANAGR